MIGTTTRIVGMAIQTVFFLPPGPKALKVTHSNLSNMPVYETYGKPFIINGLRTEITRVFRGYQRSSWPTLCCRMGSGCHAGSGGENTGNHFTSISSISTTIL